VVGVHGHARDGARPGDLRVEGEDLGRGRQDAVVAVEEGAEGLVPGGAVDRGLVDGVGGEVQAALDLPPRLGLEQRAAGRILIVFEQAAAGQPVAPGQPRLPDPLGGVDGASGGVWFCRLMVVSR